MIKSNELRCGNTLHYLTAEGDVLPTTIDWQDIQWISENEKDFNTVHRPIPLTQDWLKRFGFENKVFLNWSISKSIDQDSYLIYKGHDCMYLHVKYVHQLQNLYFALTQTELTPSDGGKIE